MCLVLVGREGRYVAFAIAEAEDFMVDNGVRDTDEAAGQ